MKFKPLGDTKAHKLTYLSELSMINDCEKGFNYDFRNLPYGPYSEELQEDIDWVEEQKPIDPDHLAMEKYSMTHVLV